MDDQCHYGNRQYTHKLHNSIQNKSPLIFIQKIGRLVKGEGAGKDVFQVQFGNPGFDVFFIELATGDFQD